MGMVKQADVDGSNRSDGLSTAEREELAALRWENRRLREEELARPLPHLLDDGLGGVPTSSRILTMTMSRMPAS